MKFRSRTAADHELLMKELRLKMKPFKMSNLRLGVAARWTPETQMRAY